MRDRDGSNVNPIEQKRILVTGPTSQVARPIVERLARDNDVVGLARFTREKDRAAIAALGATTLAVDLADGDLDAVPDDFDFVLHFAVMKTGDFEYDLRANAEGVGRLMARCRRAKAFLHCSTAGPERANMPHSMCSCQKTTYRWCRKRSLNFLHAPSCNFLSGIWKTPR